MLLFLELNKFWKEQKKVRNGTENYDSIAALFLNESTKLMTACNCKQLCKTKKGTHFTKRHSSKISIRSDLVKKINSSFLGNATSAFGTGSIIAYFKGNNQLNISTITIIGCDEAFTNT